MKWNETNFRINCKNKINLCISNFRFVLLKFWTRVQMLDTRTNDFSSSLNDQKLFLEHKLKWPTTSNNESLEGGKDKATKTKNTRIIPKMGHKFQTVMLTHICGLFSLYLTRILTENMWICVSQKITMLPIYIKFIQHYKVCHFLVKK